MNLQYTPYRLPRNASRKEVEAHRQERAFYDMTGGKNLFDYITTEGKISDKEASKLTMLEYLQKSTGVFNQNGMISVNEVAAMKARLRTNRGTIYHGFISLSEEDSYKIDTPEKCIGLIKSTFGKFFEDAHLDKNNIDLMCALHLDKPHHLHIHFTFWEKEPKYKGKNGNLEYRRKSKIEKTAIDNLFVRLGLYIDSDKDKLYKSRVEAIRQLREMTYVKTAMTSSDEIREAVIALAKDLPKTGRLSYGSKDMEAYKERVDGIVDMLLDYDRKARKADLRFYKELDKRKRKIENICGKPYAFSGRNIQADEIEGNMPKYHNAIDTGKIKIIEEIEADYKRRQGNLVIELAKFIKPEYYEKPKYKSLKPNDHKHKRCIAVSTRKINRLFGKFLSSFGQNSELLERDFSRRLQEIEEEMERERKEKNNKEVSTKD